MSETKATCGACGTHLGPGDGDYCDRCEREMRYKPSEAASDFALAILNAVDGADGEQAIIDRVREEAERWYDEARERAPKFPCWGGCGVVIPYHDDNLCHGCGQHLCADCVEKYGHWKDCAHGRCAASSQEAARLREALRRAIDAYDCIILGQEARHPETKGSPEDPRMTLARAALEGAPNER